jgi:hypothetical protein
METRLGARRIVSTMSAGSLIGLHWEEWQSEAIKALGFVLIAAAAKVATSKQ